MVSFLCVSVFLCVRLSVWFLFCVCACVCVCVCVLSPPLPSRHTIRLGLLGEQRPLGSLLSVCHVCVCVCVLCHVCVCACVCVVPCVCVCVHMCEYILTDSLNRPFTLWTKKI